MEENAVTCGSYIIDRMMVGETRNILRLERETALSLALEQLGINDR